MQSRSTKNDENQLKYVIAVNETENSIERKKSPLHHRMKNLQVENENENNFNSPISRFKPPFLKLQKHIN